MTEPLKAVPPQEQPIAPEKLRELYVEVLEFNLEQERLQHTATRLQITQGTLSAKIKALMGDEFGKWDVDYKTGKMTRRNPA